MYKSKVKVADFRDKASLGKLLKTDLKKSLAVLEKNQGETLPFFFEYDLS
jgi:ribosomal protein L7Ae-like RNA K-turn-binding protein